MISSDIIKKQLDTNQPFAIFKLPNENTIYLIIPDDVGNNTYFFNSFDNTKKYEFGFTSLQKVYFHDLEKIIFSSLSIKENVSVTTKNEYISLLEKTVQFLREEKAHKIVISREKWIDKTNINPIQSFLLLSEKYPNSFCHLSYWNDKEIWLGATPEVLGTFDNSALKTMSLAGTLPDKNSFEWSDKELEEQKFVTDYIYEKLKSISSIVTMEGPQTLHLGHIKHLVTYFSANLNNPSLLPKAIQSLHPTPAVCGIPLDISRNYILKEEGYNRDFYSGYIGLKTQESEKYFVNLRCGKLYKNGALLFVGGGITSQSNPEEEWRETELKSKFIGESL